MFCDKTRTNICSPQSAEAPTTETNKQMKTKHFTQSYFGELVILVELFNGTWVKDYYKEPERLKDNSSTNENQLSPINY